MLDLLERNKMTYEDYYDQFELHKFNLNEYTQKYIVGKNTRKCRFCGKEYPETKFRTDAHAIPRFLGNKYIFDYNECDECNSFFGKNIEAEFDKFINPFLIINKIDGRNGLRNYKDDKTNITHPISNIFDLGVIDKNTIGIGNISSAPQIPQIFKQQPLDLMLFLDKQTEEIRLQLR